MLIEFSVENFRSMREKCTFSMLASSDNLLEDNLIKMDVLGEDRLLKTAAIYGANASGKSNVLMAIGFLKALVLNSHNHQKGQKISFFPFKLGKNQDQPTKFEIVFIKENTKYVYNVSFNADSIIDEILCYYPNGRKAIIFERKNTGDYSFTVDKEIQKLFSERTLDNMLYLSKATQENYKLVFPAFEWFRDNLQVIQSENPAMTNFTANLLKDSPEMKQIILKSLLEADLGIEDVSTEVKKVSLPDSFPPQLKELLLRENPHGLDQIEISTSHKGVKFDFNSEESEGTKRIFSLIGPWIDSLKNGRVLLVDELDTRLHHLLNIFLINLFQDPTQNLTNAQLIFTTHNVLLLNEDIFRRDQIWFTEKNNKDGSTDLYSILEYTPRKDKDLKNGYLAGKYGALPFIKNNRIF